MKHAALLTSSILAFSFCLSAQEDMTQVWNTRLEHKIEHTGTDPNPGEEKFSYAASDKEMTVFRNKDGGTIWTKPFKDMAPRLRKIDELIPFWESNTVFLFERKGGADVVACIDLPTGNVLWTTEKYSKLSEDNVIYLKEKDAFCISTKDGLFYIMARTGEEKWASKVFTGSVGKYHLDGDDMTCVNFVGPGLAALFSGFRNQIARIDLNTGTVKWESSYIGRAERKVVTRDFVYDLNVEGGKVFLNLNGIQVYDYTTGALQWSAAFDYTPEGVAKPPAHAVKFGVYGAVADPVVDGNDLYVLDMQDKRHQFVKKYDRMTGKLIWTSPEIKDARAIPGMWVADGKVVLQVGGTVETQSYIYWRETQSDGSVVIHKEWRVDYPNIKPVGVQAFNTTDGALAWDSERFRKGITNCLLADDRMYVCSGKSLYCIDHKTGADIYEIALGDDGISLANRILLYKDMVAIIGDKGVSTHARSNGALVKSNKYRASSMEAQHEDMVLMKTERSDIAAFDLDDCSFKQFNARNGATTELSYDGMYVYVYEKKEVTKLRTR
ncbi:MAG: PQQ-binding-like beta-propeller repeat protein [Flavobacteriales bacterium]|nr:PQQ-binding-like beta-propeller repeat protein [Flavobacteriales bacterium]MCC6938198.1 PQQ-binding-like beta-propeller repeat protein [Flavobacteriales bacterium]